MTVVARNKCAEVGSPKRMRDKERRRKAEARSKRLRVKLRRFLRKAKSLGFRTAEEYMLFLELRRNNIYVRHNIHLRGTEVDLYVPPKLIIEVGYRDKFLLKKWDDFEKAGFSFLYFANIEIHDPHALKRCVSEVLAAAAHVS